MAISRYDVPAQADFKSTYVPIPFDEMMQIGEKTAARREQGMLMADELSASLQDFPVAPGADEAWYQENIKGLEGVVDDAVQNLDPGSYEFRRKIMGATRKQTRNPEWRLAKQNYDRYWEARKMLQENADLPAANRRELENYLDAYQEQGFQGMGAFQAPGVREYSDYYDYLNKKGQGFRTSGIEQGFLNKDGTLKIKSKRSGVHVSRVANEYGYSYDPDAEAGAELTLDRIPGSFVGSPEGQQMMLEAQDMSRYNGRSPEENFADLYVNTTLPLVNKYSGMQISDDVNMTAWGTKMREGEAYADTVLSTLNERIKGEVGSEFGEDSLINKALVALPGEYRKIVKSAIEKFNPIEGQSLEDTLESIDGAFNTSGVPADNLALKGLMNLTGKALKELAKFTYTNNAPDAPSEDYKEIAQEVMKEAGIEGRWEDLSPEKRQEVHKMGKEYVKNFYDTGVHVATSLPVSRSVRKDRAETIFGYAGDNGVVTQENISGTGLMKKVVDPRNPGEELVLNDLVSKGSTVEYIGKTSYDNPYGPGLHTIGIDGNEYYMYLGEGDKIADVIPYNLYEYKRNLAGLGTWFQQQDYFLRGVERDGEPAIEVLTEEQYKEAVRSGQISKDGRGKAVSSEVFNAGQGQSIMDVYEYQFKPFAQNR